MSRLCTKYTVITYILLLSAILLGGCSKPVDEKQETKTTDWPEEVSYCDTRLSLAFSGNKELYVENGVIHVRDVESGVSAILCTRPNCTHQSHSATDGESHCEATSPPNAFGDFEAVALHGDTVFQFFVTEDNIYNTQLYISHVGKSGRKKVLTLPYMLYNSAQSVYFEKNNAYFTACREEKNEDGTRIIKTRQFLLKMNLDTYEVTVLDEYSSDTHIQIGSLDYNDGVLAYTITERDEDDADCDKVHLYNVRTEEKRSLDSFVFHDIDGYSGYLGYREGCIYYVAEAGDRIIKLSLDSGEETNIVTLDKGKAFYECWMNYNMGIEYETSDVDKVNADNWDSDDKRSYYYSFEDGKTYPVKQKYTKMSGIIGIMSKNTAYYLGEKDDKFIFKWVPIEEYLDKKED